MEAATGTALWSVGVGAPIEVDPSALRLAATGDIVIAVVDFFGEIHAVRDDGASGALLSGFQLPTGAPAAGSPGSAVAAVSPVVADATGKPLVGADDGQLYPMDLVTGTVGAPVEVDTTAGAAIDSVKLEPPAAFATTWIRVFAGPKERIRQLARDDQASGAEHGVDEFLSRPSYRGPITFS